MTSFSNVEIFKDLSSTDLSALAAVFTKKSFPANSTIVKEGDQGREFFIVETGTVSVFRGRQGKDIFICQLGPGDYFGESSLFDEVPRSATVKSLEGCELLAVDPGKFGGYLELHPKPAKQILFAMLRELFRRLQATSSELEFERKDGMDQSAIDKLFT